MRKPTNRKPTKRKHHVIVKKPPAEWSTIRPPDWNTITPPVPPPSAAETLTARQSTHGDFSENARVMQGVKRVLRTGWNWTNFLNEVPTQSCLNDVQAEAIEMIVVKLGRIVTGDPNNPDHYLDIEGYARLARERLPS